MTRPDPTDPTTAGCGGDCPARGRASCSVRNSSAARGCGGVSDAHAPTPNGAGETSWHQGAPGGEAATGGGPQPGGEPPSLSARRQRPRLRQNLQRDHVRSVRLTADELATVQTAAKAVGLTTAGFLADAAVALAHTKSGAKLWLVDQRALVEELMTVGAQLARAGNNLNQIARVLNSGGHSDHVDQVVDRVLRAAVRVEAAAVEIARRR
ncbi:MobC family plasmid mobilization relaxosome protein [Streptomyces jumonjinensis]|uniref:MobC family plasmid mobilization relaxosome protein n=1 Tax=Streptomyces jumonjinensis TaxID=1945 RepID=A0A646KSC7_STRJU|nr:MobC family plasmid mobilization relaxosome protein [Streptomyces jumonjinensis]MQT04751.1 MobC family plasmid mobilization relaxosome protein [Streptomyces jumonjinensis]